MTPAALARKMAVDPALVADVMTAAGDLDPVADAAYAQYVVTENIRNGGTHSAAVLLAYRSRGAKRSGDDGWSIRIETSGVTAVTRAGRVVGHVVERRQSATFVRLVDEDTAASCVLGRLRGRVLPGGLVELVTDERGVEVRPGVPTS